MVIIRESIIADAPHIVEFQIKMALETESLLLDKTIVSSGVEAIFKDKSKGVYYVAEIDGKVIGSTLTTFEWSDWRNGRVLWFQSVFIMKNRRGNGVFRKMYEHIKRIVDHPDSDLKGIRLYVDKTNKPAQAVYNKLGMKNHHYELYEWMK